MKKKLLGVAFFGLLLTAMAVLPLTALAGGGYGTSGDCIMGCGTANNACFNCCEKTFGSCDSGCSQTYQSCMSNCQYAPDLNNPASVDVATQQYKQCKGTCSNNMQSCDSDCNNVKKNFNCPGYMPPQKCSYDCQAWNPASRSCVGPAMNGCN